MCSDILQLPSRALDEQQYYDKESRQQHQDMGIEQVGEGCEERGGGAQRREEERQELGAEDAMHSEDFRGLKRTVEAKDMEAREVMLEGVRHVESSVAMCAMEAFAQELRAAQQFIGASERDEQGASAHRTDLLNN